jgi:hypothetical protein
MLSFLFWNIDKKKEAAAPYVARLALTYSVDLFLLAECSGDLAPVLDPLNNVGRGVYQCPEVLETKVRVLSRLPPGLVVPSFTNLGKDMTIWAITGRDLPTVLLAAVHLMSKAGGTTPGAQGSRAGTIAKEIADDEDRKGSRATVLVGDLNMNPYEPGMVLVTGFHGLMTKPLAAEPDRGHMGADYRRFYNPMWGLFGDRTSGPPGTHFWDSSMIENHHWHMYDQVLLRPALMDRLRNLQILASDGYCSFLAPDGSASKEHLSDHLPILFQLDL